MGGQNFRCLGGKPLRLQLVQGRANLCNVTPAGSKMDKPEATRKKRDLGVAPSCDNSLLEPVVNTINLRWRSGLLAVCVLAGAYIPITRGDDRVGPPPEPRGRYDGPQSRSPGPPRQPDSLNGTLLGFNLGPQGEPEGLLVKDIGGKILQVNFPPPVGAKVQQAVAVGDAVTLSAVPMRSVPDHPVYGLVSVTGAKGQKVDVAPPGEPQSGHAEGTIKYLNYDRGGEINGAVLISGDFVEIGPSAAQLNLQPGEKLTADGPARPMPDGQQCIRADTVNGKSVDRFQDRQGRGERGQRPAALRNGAPQQGPDDRGLRGRGATDRVPGDRGEGPSDRGSASRGPQADANGNGPEDGPPPAQRGGQRGRGDRPPPPPQNDRDGRRDDGNQPPPPGGRDAPPPPPDRQ